VEEEGIGITSDVVEVKDEDPDTPGSKGGQGEEGCRRSGSLVCPLWLARDETPGP